MKPRAPNCTFTIELSPASARGCPMGEANGMAKHDDQVVQKAHALHAAGMPVRVIARELGVARRTVRDWISSCRRRPPARYIARRRAVVGAPKP